ncbi:MAG: release factor glutamine methyltransferase [Hyphomicrobiaceae bacterium]
MSGDDKKPSTLLDYLQLATGFLEGKGVVGARLDAEVLLAHALGLTRMELYTNFDRLLAPDEVDRFRELLRRRGAHEPAAYITGEREFWSLAFTVDRRVLVPRPETEHLVEWALDAARERSDDSAGTDLRILDLGTGSGAIAVALASELPGARFVASDRSEAALEIAPANAKRHGVAERIEFVCAQTLDGMAERGPFDLIVSNPPYITEDEYRELSADVREFEPKPALLAGVAGLDVIEPLVASAAVLLRSGGLLLIEVGTQADAVRDLFKAAGYHDVSVRQDLAGHDRIVGGRAS